MAPTRKEIAVSLMSIGLGLWTFVKTNEVSGPSMEPILAACQNTEIPLSEFAEKTGYHAYDAKFGCGAFNWLVCLITQFLLDLVQQYPAGILTWMSTLVVAIPLSTWMTLEAGRKDAKGPIRYPVILGLIMQVFGISVMFPLVWIPSYCLGRGKGGINLKRVYASIPLMLPGMILSVFLFTLPTDSSLWASCAAILGGPVVVFLSCFLWAIPDPDPKDEKALKESNELSAKAFAVAGIISLVAWFWLVFMVAIPHYGFSISAIWNDIWAGEEANPYVKFMTIDAGCLWLAGLLAVGFVKEQAGIEALLCGLFFGPGAGTALVLAGLQVDDDAQLQEATTKKAAAVKEQEKETMELKKKE